MPVSNPLSKQRAKILGVEVCRPFEIERNGVKVRMTEADLAQSCKNLNANFLPSTLALDAGDGHPKGGPAYGEAERYFMKGGVMCADIEGEADVVAEMRRGGRYPHRSMKFSRKEGVDGWYPEHICALGVMPPQIKGLAPIGADQVVLLSEAGDEETLTFFLLDGADRSEEVSMPTPTGTVELSEYNKLQAELNTLKQQNAEKDIKLAETTTALDGMKALEVAMAEVRHESITNKAEKIINGYDNGTNMTGPLKEVLTLCLGASMEGADEITLSEPGLEPRQVALADGIKLIAERLPKEGVPAPARKDGIKLVPNGTDEIKLSERQATLMKAQGYKPGTEAWDKQAERVIQSTREIRLREAS